MSAMVGVNEDKLATASEQVEQKDFSKIARTLRKDVLFLKPGRKTLTEPYGTENYPNFG